MCRIDGRPIKEAETGPRCGMSLGSFAQPIISQSRVSLVLCLLEASHFAFAVSSVSLFV